MPVKIATMPEKPRAARRRIREDAGIREDADMIGRAAGDAAAGPVTAAPRRSACGANALRKSS
jgi:hypothetical protein